MPRVVKAVAATTKEQREYAIAAVKKFNGTTSEKGKPASLHSWLPPSRRRS
jgi:hypothetical protein